MIPTLQSRMPNRLFELRCPSCGKDMKYKENLNSPSKSSDLSSKRKKCVFCGRAFLIRSSIVKCLS